MIALPDQDATGSRAYHLGPQTAAMHVSIELSALWLAYSTVVLSTGSPAEANKGHDIKRACPDYKQYSTFRQ